MSDLNLKNIGRMQRVLLERLVQVNLRSWAKPQARIVIDTAWHRVAMSLEKRGILEVDREVIQQAGAGPNFDKWLDNPWMVSFRPGVLEEVDEFLYHWTLKLPLTNSMYLLDRH